MTVLAKRDPAKNSSQWYAVEIQPTLFCKHAVLCGSGSCGRVDERWRILPAESQEHAEEMAEAIVAEKREQGYQPVTAFGMLVPCGQGV